MSFSSPSHLSELFLFSLFFLLLWVSHRSWNLMTNKVPFLLDKRKRLLKPANNNKSAFLLNVGRIWEVLSDCLTFRGRKGQPLFFKPVAKHENSLLLKYACSCFRPVLLWKSGIYVPHGASRWTTHMCLCAASLRPPLKAFWTDLRDIINQMINLYPCQVQPCADDLLRKSCRNAIYPNWLQGPARWWQNTLHH